MLEQTREHKPWVDMIWAPKRYSLLFLPISLCLLWKHLWEYNPRCWSRRTNLGPNRKLTYLMMIKLITFSLPGDIVHLCPMLVHFPVEKSIIQSLLRYKSNLFLWYILIVMVSRTKDTVMHNIIATVGLKRSPSMWVFTINFYPTKPLKANPRLTQLLPIYARSTKKIEWWAKPLRS